MWSWGREGMRLCGWIGWIDDLTFVFKYLINIFLNCYNLKHVNAYVPPYFISVGGGCLCVRACIVIGYEVSTWWGSGYMVYICIFCSFNRRNVRGEFSMCILWIDGDNKLICRFSSLIISYSFCFIKFFFFSCFT